METKRFRSLCIESSDRKPRNCNETYRFEVAYTGANPEGFIKLIA